MIFRDIFDSFGSNNIFRRLGDDMADNKILHPFRVILNKEISDHVRSWRFLILIAIILLTCLGSTYTALSSIGKAVKPNDPEGTFFFLKLFTISDNTLPSFSFVYRLFRPFAGYWNGI